MRRVLQFVRHYLHRDRWSFASKKTLLITIAMLFMAMVVFVPQDAREFFTFMWCSSVMLLVILCMYDTASDGISAVAKHFIRRSVIRIHRVEYRGGAVGLLNLRTGIWAPLQEGDLLMLTTSHEFQKDAEFAYDPC